MMKTKLRVVFMGTPDVAVPFLEFLGAHENIIYVCSPPDTPQGRHLHPTPFPVTVFARTHQYPLVQTHTLSDPSVIDKISAAHPDVIIVVAFGYKLPKEILRIPKYGCFNIHFSLLPKYRGAGPVAWAIASGEKETGVTSFLMSDTLDTGDIVVQEKTDIHDDDTTETLLLRLVDLGVVVLEKTLDLVRQGSWKALPQNSSNATKAPKLKKTDGEIDWEQANYEIRNRMRGFHPWPGSYSHIKHGDEMFLIKLFDAEISPDIFSVRPGTITAIDHEKGMQVSCGEGSLWIKNVQPANSKMMSAYQASIGRIIQVGSILQ